MITLKRHEWDKIEAQIKEEYKDTPSIFLLRSTMKRVLGFTTREHRYWSPDEMMGHNLVYLDFFDEGKKAFFILKYL